MSFVQDLENFFVIVDYLFVTSYHEELNYSILEALVTKTLVISNDIEGVSEIIKNKVNGLLIKNNNHQNFFDSIM
jgi:glycosyltransferase involved in cell wall biosynthesis